MNVFTIYRVHLGLLSWIFHHSRITRGPSAFTGGSLSMVQNFILTEYIRALKTITLTFRLCLTPTLGCGQFDCNGVVYTVGILSYFILPENCEQVPALASAAATPSGDAKWPRKYLRLEEHCRIGLQFQKLTFLSAEYPIQ